MFDWNMKLIFFLTFIIVLLGGGLFTVIRYDEYENRFTISFCSITTIAGILLVGWGLYFHVSGTILWSSKGGPVTGAQLMIMGALLSIFSGIQAINLIKKANNQNNRT